MKPIISPWVFYWIDVFKNIDCLCDIALLVGGIILGVCILILPIILDIFSDYTKMLFNILKKVAIAFVVFAIVGTFIPSKETMYTMLVAQNVTVENIEIATETIKDSVDYIFDKFDGGDVE